MDDPAIFHFDDAMGPVGEARVMGYYQQCLAKFFCQPFKNIKYNFTVFFVQVAGWFVTHDDIRIVNKGTCYCYPLFFTPRYPVRIF